MRNLSFLCAAVLGIILLHGFFQETSAMMDSDEEEEKTVRVMNADFKKEYPNGVAQVIHATGEATKKAVEATGTAVESTGKAVAAVVTAGGSEVTLKLFEMVFKKK